MPSRSSPRFFDAKRAQPGFGPDGDSRRGCGIPRFKKPWKGPLPSECHSRCVGISSGLARQSAFPPGSSRYRGRPCRAVEKSIQHCSIDHGPACRSPSRGNASTDGGVRDDLDVDFPSPATFEEVGGGVRNVAAERLERIPSTCSPSMSELSTYQTLASSSKVVLTTATCISGPL